jgi:hypothetical protein
MFQLLQIVAVLLVAIAMALSLAHALEYPGKLRLTKEKYLAVQPIYYPGFTFGGAAEPLGIIVLIVLTFTTSVATPFWLTAGALIALIAAHAVYWVMTHPVNNFWLRDFELRGASGVFFRSDPLRRESEGGAEPDWTAYRDRWESSHLIRAVLSFLSLLLLATAIVVSS